LMEATRGQMEAGLRTLFEVGTAVGLSDSELLDLFLVGGGPAAELAFAALVEWHGPMVWRVCRDVLRESNDADDAFQATFLILARRAGAIRKRSSVGPWLHGVALRVARSSRSRALRRQQGERVAAGSEQDESMSDFDRLDTAPILHEEVGRLPEKYRVPLVLCYFQGLTHDQAASQLGWPVGTVRSRMAKARDRLRQRLLRRGVTPSVAILVSTGRLETSAAVPAALASATVRTALALGAGAAGTVPAAAAALSRTVIREMNLMKTSMIATCLVSTALVGAAGMGYVAVAAQPRDQEKAVTAKSADQAPKGDAAASKIMVAVVQSKAETITQEYVCRINSHRHIEVRAPAEGYLSAIPVKEGQAVKKGDVMFEIGPVLHKARLDAEVADRDLAQLELNNTRKLAEKNGVSQDQVKLFEVKLAKAQAKVDLSTAELNFTKFRAPFDGLVGRPSCQEGSFVLKGDNLVSLSDNSSMWVFFNMPEKRYLEYMAETDQEKENSAIGLRLADHSKFPEAGKIAAIEASFNNATGNISFRADFPNPKGLLRHGQSGTIVISRVVEDAIVIPRRARFANLGKRYVYVVDQDNIAHQREIIIQHEVDDGFVIKTGVAVGDKIVVDGVELARDGGKVE
jgi:membrane fusion protein (multidrug efflux system)